MTPIVIDLRENNNYINLKDCTVTFLMTNWKENMVIINKLADIVSDNGIIQYVLNQTEASLVGDFKIEIIVNYPDGKKSFHPHYDFYYLSISQNLRDNLDGGDFDSDSDVTIDGGNF